MVEDKRVALSNGKELASYPFVTGSNHSKTDKEAITQRLEADGVDLIIILQLVDVKDETRYVPGSTMSGDGGFWGGFGYAAPIYD